MIKSKHSYSITKHGNFENKNVYHLIQGDCIKVLRELPIESVDLVLTDPPWGIKKKDYDSVVEKEYFVWYERVVIEIFRVLKNGGSLLIEVSKERLFPTMKCLNKFFNFKQPIICYVNNQIGHRSLVGWSHFTMSLWYTKGYAKVLRRYRDVIEVPLISSKKENWSFPNPKIVKFYETLLLMFSEEGDTILDPFLGSGTTMLASQNLKRNCIGIEINPKYYEVVKKRCFGRKFLDREVEYKSEVFNE